ncbi:MAG: OadG family protein [Saccharospirillum sp.]
MSDFMQEGLMLMVMGMGTVFVFLTVLVIGTVLMSKLISLTTSQAELDSQVRKPASGREDLTELAAVAAAVKAMHER